MSREKSRVDENVLAARIRWLREEVWGISTQLEMAEKVGVSPYVYNNWETGRTEPGAIDFIKILHACPDEQTRSQMWSKIEEKPLDSEQESNKIRGTKPGKKQVFLEPTDPVIPKPRGKK